MIREKPQTSLMLSDSIFIIRKDKQASSIFHSGQKRK